LETRRRSAADAPLHEMCAGPVVPLRSHRSNFETLPSQAPATEKGATGPLDIVSANYVVRAAWAKGYVVDMTVVVNCLNSGRKNRFGVDGFQISFDLTDGAQIVKTWNAKLARDGSVCTATHEGFCAPVHREQAVLYFGFEAQLDMAPPRTALSLPSSISVNGQVCPVVGCFARDLADCRNDCDEEDSDDEPWPPTSPKREDTPSHQDDADVARTRRSGTAPPVLYKCFGLASPRAGGEGDELSHLANTSVCADDWDSDGCQDDVQSVAETVRFRDQRRDMRDREQDAAHECDSEVKGGLVEAALTPPTTRAACCTSTDNDGCMPPATRKRKFLEEENSPDHTPLVCFESSSVSTPPAEPQPSRSALRYPKTLEVDYYRRSRALKKRKYLHMDYLDSHFRSREQVILNSVLDDVSKPIVLEPNMFPYDTPPGVTHWTLWSRKWLEEDEVDEFINGWLAENLPEAIEWNHDDNMADGLSINLYHVHVYVRCPA